MATLREVFELARTTSVRDLITFVRENCNIEELVCDTDVLTELMAAKEFDLMRKVQVVVLRAAR